MPASTTPFPNRLLDEILPLVTDTEWRVMCVITRQTLGWHNTETGGRKTRDWLTHKQLQLRTGRAGAAISQAIEGLVAKALLCVEDADGNALTTAVERRRTQGRLYYRLHPRLLEAETNIEAATSESEARSAQTEAATSEILLRKAKTTKENENKNYSPIASDVTQFMDTYRTLFAEKSPQHLAPPQSEEREEALIQNLLTQYGLETLVGLLHAYFRLEDLWVKQQGYSLSVFRHRLPQLLMKPLAPAKQSEPLFSPFPSPVASAPAPDQRREDWQFSRSKRQFVRKEPGRIENDT